MKNLIGLAMIAAVLYGAYKLWEVYDASNTTQRMEQKVQANREFGQHLQGLDYRLEQRLRESYAKGVLGLAAFIKDYGNSPSFLDPRLAWVEMDYAMLLIQRDPIKAKKVFQQVRSRIGPNSPVESYAKECSAAFDKIGTP